jgi:hypothetical protein
LADAVAGLARLGDTGPLASLVASVDGVITPSEYSEPSRSAFTSAVAGANALVNSDPADVAQDQVDAAHAALAAAIAGLTPSVAGNTTALTEVVGAAAALDPADYTPATWAPVAVALAVAERVLDVPHPSAGAVDRASTALQAAVGGLVLDLDSAGLSQLIATVTGAGLVASDYTAASWQALQGALTGGRAALTALASQAAVDGAFDALTAAVAGLAAPDPVLPPTPVVKAGLTGAIASAQGLEAASYTPASFVAYRSALAAAQATASDAGASQAQVDAAAVALVKAVAGLVFVTGGSAPSPGGDSAATAVLKVLADQVATLAQGAHTEASWVALTVALTGARAALADPGASAAQVEAASVALAQAVAGLKVNVADEGKIPLEETLVVKVKASQSVVRLAKGQKLTLAAFGYDSAGLSVTPTFTSSNRKTASVDAKGTITAKKPGKVTITVKAGSKSAKVKVTVVAKAKSVKVKTVSVRGIKKTLTLGTAAYASVKWAPSSSTGIKVTYKSSNPKVATVDKAGRIVAKAKGKAVLTVKAGAKTKKVTVTVK